MTAPNETLRTILPIAGWGDGQAADVVFTGGADPVLPTPFCIGAAGAAALAASGPAATEPWRAPTRPGARGNRQLPHAPGAPRRSPFNPLPRHAGVSRPKTIQAVHPPHAAT